VPAAGDTISPFQAKKKTQFPRSAGVRGSRARCSLIEKSDRVSVFFHRWNGLIASPPTSANGPHGAAQ
jgi:hypothetical protein